MIHPFALQEEKKLERYTCDNIRFLSFLMSFKPRDIFKKQVFNVLLVDDIQFS